MASIVIYDASVLYPSTLRDLLLRVAQAGLVQAKWTEAILDEAFAALRKDRPDLDPARLDRTRALMATAVRDWRVDGYERLIPTLTLPDPDDRYSLPPSMPTRPRSSPPTCATSPPRHSRPSTSKPSPQTPSSLPSTCWIQPQSKTPSNASPHPGGGHQAPSRWYSTAWNAPA